jgi:hypothetical protein
MIRKAAAVAAMTLLMAFLVPSPAFASEESSQATKLLASEHIRNEIVFTVSPGQDPANTAAGAVASEFRQLSENTYLVEVPWWYGSKLALIELLADPAVLIAEPNFISKHVKTSTLSPSRTKEVDPATKLINVS